MYSTKLNLTLQSKINLGDTAIFDGSMSLGQNFYVSGIQVDTRNAFENFVLAYDPLTLSFKPTPASYVGIEGNRVINGMQITPIDNLNYSVSNGVYRISNNYYVFNTNSFSVPSGDTLYDRYDIAYVSGDTISLINTIIGNPAPNPIIPTLPNDCILLCILNIKAGTTATSTGNTQPVLPSVINALDVQYYRGIYTNVSDFLDSNYAYPKVEIFENNVNSTQFGNIISAVTFSWSVNKKGNNFNLTPTGSTYNNTTFNHTFNGLFITGNTSNSATTFTLVFDDGITTAGKNSTISFYNKLYYGVSSAITLTSTGVTNNVNGLNNNQLTGTGKLSQVFMDGQGKYSYFCYPSRFGPANFFINGFYNNDFTLSVQPYTNEYGFIETYNIYRTNNLVYSNNMSFEIK